MVFIIWLTLFSSHCERWLVVESSELFPDWGFRGFRTDRATKAEWSLCGKTEGKYVSVETEQYTIMPDVYCIAFGSFSSLFLVLCSSSDVVVYLYLWACLFPPVRHSFASLIDKQLSIKATLQDVLWFELFQRTYLILNQLRIISRQNVLDRKNMHCPITAPRGQYTFSGPLVQQPVSLRHELKTNSTM